MASDNVNEQVAWNLAAALLQSLQQNLDKASDNYLKENLKEAFYCLKAVKMRVIQNINDEEEEGLIVLENKLQPAINAVRILKQRKQSFQSIDSKEQETLSKIVFDGWNTYEEYNNTLMKILEKYGYLIGKKEDASQIHA